MQCRCSACGRPRRRARCRGRRTDGSVPGSRPGDEDGQRDECRRRDPTRSPTPPPRVAWGRTGRACVERAARRHRLESRTGSLPCANERQGLDSGELWRKVGNRGDRQAERPQTRAMFFGKYEHSIDDKSRITLPRRFRDALADGVVLSRGLDGNVDVYPREAWKVTVEARICALDPLSRETRELRTLFFSGAADADPDTQGRVLVPAALTRHGQLEQGRHRGREQRPPRDLGPHRLGGAPGWGRRERRTCCRTSCRTARLTTSPSSRTRCASSSPCSPARRSSTRPSAPAATRACSRRTSQAAGSSSPSTAIRA